MKLRKILALTLATIMTITSLSCVNIYAASDDLDSHLGHILGENLENVLNTSFLTIPDNKSLLRLDKGYKAIWSNTRDITTDDIKNVVNFYETNGDLDENPSFSYAIIGTSRGNVLTRNSSTSYYRTFADFLCVYYDSRLYYIPFVASPPTASDADNIYLGTDLVPQKPKRVTLLQTGTPNYYLKNYQNGYKFADTYSDYKLYWDFYDENEIYFLRNKDKLCFKGIADKETTGDFYDAATKTDGDLYWLKADYTDTTLYSKIESGNNSIDVGTPYGSHYVPVFASNDSDDFAKIKVYNPTGIKVSVKPTRTSYVEGETFDPSGMKVIMNCSDNNNEFEITDYTYDTNTLTTDTTSVKVYTRLNNNLNCYATVPITVTKKVVSSIEMIKQPTKTSYVEGENFDPAGMVIEATYNDGTTEKINNKYLEINYATGSSLTTDDTNVNISYGAGSIDVPVNVVSKKMSSIKVIHQPDKLSYVAGQTFDLTGIVVEATYNDGTTAIINDYSYSPSTYLGSHIGNSLIGDINKDGNIDKVDAALVLKISAGMEITGTVDLVAADCNRDGTVDESDSVWILKYKPGMAFINITKDGKSDILYVNVEDKTLTGISVKTKPNKTEYIVGQRFDKSGLVVEATYNDGTTEAIEDYIIENDIVTNNMTNVYITYGNLYTTVPITVTEKSISELEVLHKPVKTEYVEGQKFDKTGLLVKATYTDGSTAIIDDYTVNPEQLSLGNTYVTISKDGKSTTTPVTVIKKVVDYIKVTKLPNKLDYNEGEEFDPTGMIIEAIYNDGTTEAIEDYTYDSKPFVAGDSSVTIKYSGASTKVKIVLSLSEDEIKNLVLIKKGDVNRDGNITPEDAIILNKIIGKIVDYGYKAVHTGDVANDGTLTNDDVTIIENYLRGNIKLSDEALINADIDGDGEVTEYDAVLVEKAVLNMWSLNTVYTANADANDDGNVNMLDVIWILNTHYKHTTIDHIEIVKQPDKTDYVEGQVFNPEGMIIEATYKDGTIEEITDYIYPLRPLTKDDTKVVISFDGHDVEQKISVYKKAIAGSDDDKYPNDSTEITTEVTTSNDNSTESTEATTEATNNGNASGVKIISMPDKVDYVEGEIIDPSGIKIEVSWNDGSVSYITADDVIVDKTPLKIDDKYGVIYYNYGDCTEKINVPVNVITKEIVNIEVVKQPDKTDYNEGEKFDKSGTKIEITYNDGTKKEFDADNITVKDDRPLTKDDTKVTIIVDGNDVNVEITVRPITTEATTERTTVTTTEVTTEGTTVTTTETTTAEITETTTKRYSSGSGGGSSSSKNTTTEATTEITTAKTTEKTTVEESTEVTTDSKKFSDVVDHWAKDYIEHLHENGIVNGVTDDLYIPDLSTKRGDFALVISRMLNLDDSNITFSDVDKDSYYAQAISNCAEANIFVGYGDGKFKPEQTITREEMFVIMAKLFAPSNFDFTNVDISILDNYNDGVDVSWWAKSYVAYLISNNAVIGDNGNIKPQVDITRAEMAVVIYKYFNK